MSDVSIIMVSYHTGPALWLAIESVLAQPECKELLLVNNGNIPPIVARLEELARTQPRFTLITGQGNVGFAKACNLGVRASTGNTILLLNPDSMLPEGGLARALDILKRYPEKTLAGCYLINPDGSEQRGGRRALLNPRNAIAESLGVASFLKGEAPLNIHTTPMPEHAHEVPAISGAFMMLPRSFYDQLNGLDEGYFLHMEDMDFCARVHQAGGKVICMPEVKVIHFRSTSETTNAFVEYHKTRGFIRYLKTHYADTYSPAFLTLMNIGIWLRYGIKALEGVIDRFFESPLLGKREVARTVLLYRLVRAIDPSQALKGKTIVVTGASGQTGACVTGLALAQGAQVIAVYNRSPIAFSHPNLTWVQRNLTVQQLGLKGDCLIHTAALWMLPDVLAGAMDGGISRVVAFGSTSMFAKVSSKNNYEMGIVAKLEAAEKQIMQTAMEKGGHVTILRPTMVYGVGMDANITRLADVARRIGILPIYEDARGLRHPVQALDLAQAALAIVNNPVTFGKAYNLGGSQMMTYKTMLTALFHHLGKRPKVMRLPYMPQLLDGLGKIYNLHYLNGEMARRMNQDLVFEIKEATADFGYNPKGFLKGDVTL